MVILHCGICILVVLGSIVLYGGGIGLHDGAL